MQIQLNIKTLEDWCREHDMGDVTLQLEHLTQATKLLQLKKATVEDLKRINDVCWILTPAQVHKLLQSYMAADYEVHTSSNGDDGVKATHFMIQEPIGQDVLRTALSRTGEKKDVLLESVPLDDALYEIPAPNPDATADSYIPDDVSTNSFDEISIAYCFHQLQLARLKQLVTTLST